MKGGFKDSTIYHYQTPSSNSEVDITPAITRNYFKSQVIVQEINPADHHYNRDNSYIFPISGTELCNKTSIVGLEYCYRERQNELGNTRRHFDFFILEPGTPQQVLDVTFSVTASSLLIRSNCTDIPQRSTMVCCSYQELSGSQTDSNARYFGIANIREYPTLLRLPNP